jgi:chorismate mutase/prephenate dehydratase
VARREKESLSRLRSRIDRIDDRIVRWLDERTSLAMRTARLKRKLGERLRQPDREAAVVRRVVSRSRVFPKKALASLYRIIMKAALTMEAPGGRND